MAGKDDRAPFDSGTTRTDSAATPDDTGTPTPPDEACNGVDDDGDGLVDEGYADLNQNGIPECLEGCGWLEPMPAGVVTRATECGPNVEPVEDPWNVEVAWRLTLEDEVTGDSVMGQSVPLFAVDATHPEGLIYLHGWSYAVSRDQSEALLISPEGEVLSARGGVEQSTGAVAADVDGDGAVEVFVRMSGERFERVDLDFDVAWSSESFADDDWTTPTVADLRGVGVPEILEQDWIWATSAGKHLGTLDGSYHSEWESIPLTGDLDQDGAQELVLYDQVHDADGRAIWRAALRDDSPTNHALPVQADNDLAAELLFVGADLLLYEADGTLIWSDTPDHNTPGPPCAGDLDGDGRMEVAVPWSQALVVYELDGSVLWSAATDDPGGAAGCSVSDLDGDGVSEVLYADEVSFGIYDGRTGVVLYRDATHESTTAFEFPVVVDLDLDGHSEILVAGGIDEPGTPLLTVYRHAGGGWTPGGTTWWAHDDSMANYNEDGTIPADPEAPWLRYGLWRGRLASRDSWPLGRDLRVAFEGACVADCDAGPLTLAFHVENAGAFDVPAGVPYTLYAVPVVGDPLPVATGSLPALAVGAETGTLFLEVDPADVGAAGLRLAVDDDGAGGSALAECREDDNQVDWREAPCAG